jgi:nitrate reductase assembly molybdenum cofactor insertion protein NarJ
MTMLRTLKHKGLTLIMRVLTKVDDSKVNSAAVDVIDLNCRSTNKTLEPNTSTSTERGKLMALDRGSITYYN